MFKFIKYSFGIFSGGFVLFSIYNYWSKSKEKISEEELIKLVKK